MRRGILISTGAALFGMVILSFCVSQNLLSKSSGYLQGVMSIERATSQNQNICRQISKEFKRSSHITIEQDEESLTLSEVLPNNLTEYAKGLEMLDTFVDVKFPESEINVHSTPNVMTSGGINFTQDSDRTIILELPDITKTVELTSYVLENISACEFNSEDHGPTHLSIRFVGYPGGCFFSESINLSTTSEADVMDGKVTVRVAGGRMSVTNNFRENLNVSVVVRLNHTMSVSPMILNGYVQTEVLDAKKRGFIEVI